MIFNLLANWFSRASVALRISNDRVRFSDFLLTNAKRSGLRFWLIYDYALRLGSFQAFSSFVADWLPDLRKPCCPTTISLMIMITALFYAFCLLTVLPALVMLLHRNVLYGALWLLLSFLGVAGLYVFAGATFLGVAQIMVYVGGIIVLLVFGIMFTTRSADNQVSSRVHNRFLGLLGAGGLLAVMLWVISKIELPPPAGADPVANQPSFENVAQIGVALMTDYLVPFEFAGVLLLVSLIAAAFIAGKD